MLQARALVARFFQRFVQVAQGLLRLTLLADADNARAQALYASEGFAGSAMRPMRLMLG